MLGRGESDSSLGVRGEPRRRGTMRAQRWIFVLLVLAALLQSLYYYPQLPPTVASHFDGAGRPNGWSSKAAFFGLYLGIVALVAFIFIVLPPFLLRLPAWLISLPNKDYWWAPERRADATSFVQRQMLWFGNASMILVICTIQLALRANLPEADRLSTTSMWILLGAYGIFALVWLVRFVSRFSKRA